MSTPLEMNLRDRKKAEAKANVLEISHRLFRKNGFDGTTLGTICQEADISKRTFFRYFRDKESLAFPRREERLAQFKMFLKQNQQIENPFESLRIATQIFGASYNDHSENLRAQQAVIQGSDALLAREREIDLDWQREIAKAFSERAGQDAESDLWARVLAGAIMGVVRSIMNYWFERDCEPDLVEMGLDSLNYLERGFPHRVN
jgi:AcrR family transcriptional regulator